jgi:hypothetical protein
VTTRERYPVGRDYQLMVTALADVAKRRDAELIGAERAYQDSAAQAAGELARAEGEATVADRRAGAAAAAVLDVDREAARLWDHLRRVKGMRARALGELPEPAPVEALPRMAIQRGPEVADAGGEVGGERPESARALLARAAERIDDGVRRVPRRPLPRWVLPLLPLVGAVVSAATGLVAAGLVTLGETGITGGVALRVLGWLAFLVAPSAGVPVAAHTAHRTLNARLDIGGVGLTLLGGMIAATILSLTFAGR